MHVQPDAKAAGVCKAAHRRRHNGSATRASFAVALDVFAHQRTYGQDTIDLNLGGDYNAALLRISEP